MLARMTTPRAARHPVVAVSGASGGLGASTLAAAVALALRPHPVTLVDGDLRGGGLDVTLGVEHLDGLRWGDLARHEGAAAGEALRRRLPGDPLPVLAARGARPSAAAAREVVAALAREGTVVLDLPVTLLVQPEWRSLTDLAVLLVGLRPRWLRDAEALRPLLADADEVVTVTRGAGRSRQAAPRVASHLGHPFVEHLPDDPRVVRAEARGRPPGGRGPVADVARALVELVDLTPARLGREVAAA